MRCAPLPWPAAHKAARPNNERANFTTPPLRLINLLVPRLAVPICAAEVLDAALQAHVLRMTRMAACIETSAWLADEINEISEFVEQDGMRPEFGASA